MRKKLQTIASNYRLFPTRRLFDSHCHLDCLDGYIKPQIEAAVASGVGTIVTVGTTIASSLKGLELQHRFPGIVLAGAGLDPELVIPCSEIFDSQLNSDSILNLVQKFQSILIHNDYKLVGECGLDYYWLEKDPAITAEQKEQSKYLQKYLLQEQLKLARLLNLPVSLHSRSAVRDCLEMCDAYAERCPIIFHSFTGTLDEASDILSKGYKIGLNGIITYKSATTLRTMVKTIVGERKINEPQDLYESGFFLETDAPLLFPSNSRTKELQNSPKQIPYIWEFVSKFLNN